MALGQEKSRKKIAHFSIGVNVWQNNKYYNYGANQHGLNVRVLTASEPARLGVL